MTQLKSGTRNRMADEPTCLFASADYRN